MKAAWLPYILGWGFGLLGLTTIALFYPLVKLPPRLPKGVRWALFVPAAFIFGYLGEVVPRLLFSLWEIVVNRHILFRPSVDELIFQIIAPGFFVVGGVLMAPSRRFRVFLILGGLKFIVAGVNLSNLLAYSIEGGGPWSTPDEVIGAPIWWCALADVASMASMVWLGFEFSGAERKKVGALSTIRNPLPARISAAEKLL